MSSKNGNLGCLASVLGFFRSKPRESAAFPYRTRDDFLSPAEKTFYRVLVSAVGTSATIFAKVRLADVLFVPKGEHWQAAYNRIQSKHLDFVICNPNTYKILAAVELDDKSHARQDRIDRDRFLDAACHAAGLPLIRVKAQAAYEAASLRAQLSPAFEDVANPITPPVGPLSALGAAAPMCPKCGVPMVLRTSKSSAGDPTGQQFYGCENYPRCREIRAIFSRT